MTRPKLSKGPKIFRDIVEELCKYIEINRPVSGIGSNVYDSPGGRPIDVTGTNGGASASLSYPFKVYIRALPGSDPATYQAGVEYNSTLFRNIEYDSNISITGLLSEDQSDGWFDINGTDRIWIEGTFSSWPILSSVQINSDGQGDDWGDGEVEDDGETIATQTKFRIMLATIETGGDGAPFVATQFCRTHLQMMNTATDTIAIIYPYPK